ncbi:MAG: KDP operon transcriptional regulatory protein KdpE [bacterium]|nr:KDP operon transcriptional regulatory protein KdpE [bacterium]
MFTSVLIIDTDAGVANAFVQALSQHGFSVAEALSTQEGLDALQKRKPQALILDVCVPGSPNVEFLREIRTLYPALPVIVVTAYSTSFTEAKAQREGVAGYFVKPFNLNALVEKLKMVISKNSMRRASDESALQTLNMPHAA